MPRPGPPPLLFTENLGAYHLLVDSLQLLDELVMELR